MEFFKKRRNKLKLKNFILEKFQHKTQENLNILFVEEK